MAIDRVGLIRDISQTLLNEGASIQKANFSRDEDNNVSMQLNITVRDIQHLNYTLTKILHIKNIQSATRVAATI